MKSARLSYAGHNWPIGTSELKGCFRCVRVRERAALLMLAKWPVRCSSVSAFV